MIIKSGVYIRQEENLIIIYSLMPLRKKWIIKSPGRIDFSVFSFLAELKDINIHSLTIKYEKFSQIQKAFLKCLIDNNLIINNQSNSQQMKYLNFKRQIEYFDSWSLSCESSCLAQSILNSSSICIIGAGGVGTALSMQFLSCGIGKIYLIDDDIIEESNLARQFLFSKSEIGRKKVEIISDKLNKRGLGTVVPIDNKISIHNIEDLIEMMPNVEIITGVPTPHSKNDYILLREMIKYGKAVICSDEYSSGPLLKKHSDINRYKNFKDSMFELSGDLFSKRELLKTYGSHPSYLPHILLSTSIVVDETIRIITKYTTESLSHTCYGFDPCDFKVKKYEWK